MARVAARKKEKGKKGALLEKKDGLRRQFREDRKKKKVPTLKGDPKGTRPSKRFNFLGRKKSWV